MKIFVNILTFLRLPLIIAVVLLNICFGSPTPAIFFSSLVLMVLCSLTDLLDGWLARRFQVQTEFGAHADPMLDKLFFMGVLPLLIYLSALSPTPVHTAVLTILTVVFAVRDQLVTFLRMVGSRCGMSAKATLWGKLRTATSFPATLIIYYFLALPDTSTLPVPPLSVIYGVEGYLILITLITLAHYSVYYFPAVAEELGK
ncbi:MAG: CDP-alcohol phosphatidyltransferase family protein [Fibrobacterota bacterium]